MIKSLFSFGQSKPRGGRYDGLPPAAVHAPQISNSTSVASSNYLDWATNGMMTAGVSVTESSAMQVSAVYASVALIGGAIASLPLPVYQRGKDGRVRVDHEIWWLLNEQPNPDYPAATFWEAMLSALLLHGDAFARIIRPRPGSEQITAFEWLHPSRVTVKRTALGLVYSISNDNGKSTVIAAADMIHVTGPGFNGLRGKSQISYVLRHAAGISLAADQYSAAFFENGARPDFAVELAGNPTAEQQEMMRKSWNERYQGVGRSHLPALLTNGAKVHELTMNAEDSQLIATRQFQVEDIARIFGVPPFMIGHTQTTSSWGSGVEQMGIGFVKYTLGRHLAKIEQELNRKIWPIKPDFFVEFNTAGLERGDYKTRMEGYRIALGRAGEPGWTTVNEIRRKENDAPLKGGDELNTGMTNAPTTDQTVGT